MPDILVPDDHRALSTGSELERFGLKTVDVTDRCGQVEFPDPYRQLEDESREVHAWQEHQNARTSAALTRIPGLEALTNELESDLSQRLAGHRAIPLTRPIGRVVLPIMLLSYAYPCSSRNETVTELRSQAGER